MATDARIVIGATDATKQAFKSVNNGLSKMEKSAFSLNKAFGALAGVATFGALTAGIKGVVDQADKFDKLSISLGISVESLSQYRLATELNNVSMDQFALILQRQTRRVAEAAKGTGEARDALRELGVSAVDLAKLSPDKQFEVLADAMQNVEGQSNKLRLAFKLFDSEGARPALQLMSEGADGLRKYREEADSMGLTISSVSAKQMVAFNDQLTKSKLAIQGGVQIITVSLLPVITSMSNAFLAAANAVSRFIDSFKDQKSTVAGVVAEMKKIRDEIAAFPNTPPSLFQLGRLQDLTKQYEALTGAAKGAAETIDFDIGPPMGTIAADKTAAADAKKAQDALERLRLSKANELEVIRVSLLSQEEVENNAFLNRMMIIEENYELELISLEKYQSLRENLTEKHESRIAKITTDNEKRIHDYQLKQRTDILNQSINLLAMLGTKSKAFAAAAIILESVIAAKKIFIESQVAAAAALVPPPVGLGPVAGQPLAAAILTAGKISAGLTLATGAMQLGSLGNSGGASGVYQADPLTGLPESSQGRTERIAKTDITINLSGADLLSADSVRTLIEKINEQIDDGVNVGSIRVA